MKRILTPFVLVAIAIFTGLLVVLMALAGSPSSNQPRSQQQIAEDAAHHAQASARQARIGTLVELGTDTALRVAGVLIAVLAGAELIRGVYRAGGTVEQLPALVAVLSGLFMVSRQWPSAAAVAVVGAAVAAGVFVRGSIRASNAERTA